MMKSLVKRKQRATGQERVSVPRIVILGPSHREGLFRFVHGPVFILLLQHFFQHPKRSELIEPPGS